MNNDDSFGSAVPMMVSTLLPFITWRKNMLCDSSASPPRLPTSNTRFLIRQWEPVFNPSWCGFSFGEGVDNGKIVEIPDEDVGDQSSVISTTFPLSTPSRVLATTEPETPSPSPDLAAVAAATGATDSKVAAAAAAVVPEKKKIDTKEEASTAQFTQ